MGYAWQTVEQAAVTLGISTRTIARRIAKGELESRLANGRREVNIPVPETIYTETLEGELTDSDEPSYEETVRHTVATSASGADVETGTALILAEDRARRAEMAITVIQQSTAIVRDEVRTARVGARWAWCVVAAMSAGVMIAVGWTTNNVTRAQQQTETLRERMAIVADSTERLAKTGERLQAELTSAQQAVARTEGQLQEVRAEAEQAKAVLAAKEKEKPQPTTKPSLVERMARAVAGD